MGFYLPTVCNRRNAYMAVLVADNGMAAVAANVYLHHVAYDAADYVCITDVQRPTFTQIMISRSFFRARDVTKDTESSS
jgi:hypothetical protein